MVFAMTQNLHTQKKAAGSKKAPKPPRPFRKLAYTAVALAGLALLPGQGARAQGPTTGMNSPAAVAQQLNVTNRVSLEDLKRWDKETNQYRFLEQFREDDYSFSASLKIPVEGKDVPFLVSFVNVFKDDPNLDAKKGHMGIAFGFADKKEAKMAALGGFDLSKLKETYQRITNSELRYVRLVVEKGEDENGKYLTVYVVPVKSPTAEIESGTITFGFTFDLPKNNAMGGYSLVASN